MRKKWFLLFVAIGFTVLSFAQLYTQTFIDNEFIKLLKERLSALTRLLPQDRIYLHTDKPLYKSGETIWFAAYIRNGEDLRPSSQSDIVHVELIGPKGGVEKELHLIAQNGVAQGDFEIVDDMPGGVYRIRAYTNWMKNEPNEFNREFVKEIQIQKVVLPRLLMKIEFERKSYSAGETATALLELRNLDGKPLASKKFRFAAFLAGELYKDGSGTTNTEGTAVISFSLPEDLNTSDGLLNVFIDHNGQTESVSRAIPVQLNNISLEFFPEGGDVVEGQPTRIAFRAINEFGKPVDIIGEVKTNDGQTVARFVSFYNGMGAFEFTAKPQQSYYAFVPSLKQKFKFPDVQSKGYTLNVKSLEKDKLTLLVHSSFDEELSIVLSVRSKIYFTTALTAKNGANTLEIPLSQMPAGVAVITLFDSKQIERAERLVFINSHRQLKISLSTNKPVYQPREKVELSISVTDEKGLGVPGQFSLAVIDDKLFTFADDKQGNILSQLLLEQDLTEKVEEAAFYFDSSQEKSSQALDYLLMTQGWRRFDWVQVMQQKVPERLYLAEKTIVGGKITENGVPVYDAEITLSDGKRTKSGKDGSFRFENVMLFEPIVIKAGKNGLENSIIVQEYGENYTIDIGRSIYYLLDGEQIRNINDVNAGAVAKPLKRVPVQVLSVEDEQTTANREMIPNDVEDISFNAPNNVKKPVNVLPDVVNNLPEAKIEDAVLERKERQEENVRATRYYRARIFPKPVYSPDERVENRTDFRSTIFWDGNITTDRTGKAKVVFYNSDEVTAFRVICEGVGLEGTVGRAELNYSTQLPFSLDAKVPAQAVMGDQVSINVVFTNRSVKTFEGKLIIKSPKAWQLTENIDTKINIVPNGTVNYNLRFNILNQPGKDTLYIALQDDNGNRDAISQIVETGVKGFPVALSFSGQELENQTTFNIQKPVDGSLQVGFVAYPNVIDDLLAGIESILAEPYGCFEQVSSSTYPNIVVLNYLNQTGYKDETVRKKALALIEKGYKKLVAYETKENGYEWFGGVPAHEALTAYGLMEFRDMQTVYASVDNEMILRTVRYLEGRKDGKGGFQRNPRALDGFGAANQDITNAYIVYAMAEAGYGAQLVREFDTAWVKAQKTKDPYTLGLLANAIFNVPTKITSPRALLDMLYLLRNNDGSWTGKIHSITYSEGEALTIETTALIMLAINKIISRPLEKDLAAFRDAAKFLVSKRNAFGGYGNTQATVLSLKALAAYAAYSKRTTESGDVEILVNGKKVTEKHFEKEQRGEISITGLEKFFIEGKNDIVVRFKNCQNALPYTLKATYSTLQPVSSPKCKVALKTALASKQIKVGQTIRLNASLTNTTAQGLPMTVAIIGIPGGLSPQPWQLKKMQEEKVFDFYEIIGNRLVIYYRQMKPNEIRNILLDFKAEIAGRYEGAASTAYLYYTSEHKNWQPGLNIEIK